MSLQDPETIFGPLPGEETAAPETPQRSAANGRDKRQSGPLQEAEATVAPGTPRRPAAKGRGKRRSGPLPPWLLVMFCFLFYTLLFHLWTRSPGPFRFGRFFGLLLFSLAYSMLFALVGTISKKRKVQTICAVVMVVLWAVLYLGEFFILESFKYYFSLAEIFAGRKNAEQGDFAARTNGLILKNVWRLLIYALPVAAYFLINRYGRFRRLLTRGVRRFLAIGGSGLLLMAILFALLLSADSKWLVENYSFKQAVDPFGLPTALIRECINNGEPINLQKKDRTPPSNVGDWDYHEGDTNVQPNDTLQTETGEADPSDTSVALPHQKPEKAYNVMQIDFQSLLASTSSDTIADMHRYFYSLTPSKTNDYTGLFAGKNLIIITAEGFAAELIDEELTPTLYRMATQGIYFTDYYQPVWGGSTSTGEFSVLTGIVPSHGVSSITETIGHNMYLTVGNQLIRQGYFSRAYHNNSYTYYQRNETHENLGYEKFIGMGNGMEEGVTKYWPESDQEMIDFTVPQYIDHQPFSVYYMTVSGHGLYSWAGNSMSYKHKEEVQDLPYSDTVKAFFACNLEVEYAMRDLLQMLDEAGILDDTVIVLTADHYPYCLERSDAWENYEDYLSELYGFTVSDCFGRDHNALIIYSGCIEGMGIRVDTPTYSLDIVPTLSNLFGLDYDSRLLMGRDVFSDAEPLVLWPTYSWKTDLGTYDSATGVFTPVPGAEIPEDYVKHINGIVWDKIYYSGKILDTDYYKYLFPS